MKILGKIDLENFSQKKPEKLNSVDFKRILDSLLLKLSEKINNDNGQILNFDGTILIEDEFDNRMINEQEKAFYHGKTSKEEWQRKNELKESNLAEKAITLLLNKGLGEQFTVVRASLYDDYNNGVDNVIVDKKSGNVVCGFDDVLGHVGDDGKEKKAKKIEEKMKRGGVNLKYGLSLNQKKLEICRQKNLPAFYISLSKEELNSIGKIFQKNEEKISKTERDILTKWINSMQDQVNYYDKIKLEKNLKNNLENFKTSINDMKSLI